MRLEIVWAETSRRLQAFLRSRGVPAAEAEELAQEVAVRALRSGVTFEDADDLVPWACTVAWRLRVSQLRRLQARVHEAELVDVVSLVTVEDEAISRVQARQVLDTIGELSERDRHALLQTLVGPDAGQDAKASARSAVARHRARARLLRALGGTISGGVAWIAHRSRWLAPATAVAATVGVILTIPRPGGGDRPPRATTEAPARRLVNPADVKASAPLDAPSTVVSRRQPAGRPMPVSSTTSPSKVVLNVRSNPGPQWVRVEQRTGKASDHLLCTGSFVLLPNFCVG
jgi:DNA-directed RNA polymerase specialized sigma24 family protein